jgi:hypothetical protein
MYTCPVVAEAHPTELENPSFWVPSLVTHVSLNRGQRVTHPLWHDSAPKLTLHYMLTGTAAATTAVAVMTFAHPQHNVVAHTHTHTPLSTTLPQTHKQRDWASEKRKPDSYPVQTTAPGSSPSQKSWLLLLLLDPVLAPQPVIACCCCALLQTRERAACVLRPLLLLQLLTAGWS